MCANIHKVFFIATSHATLSTASSPTPLRSLVLKETLKSKAVKQREEAVEGERMREEGDGEGKGMMSGEKGGGGVDLRKPHLCDLMFFCDCDGRCGTDNWR